MTDTTRLCIWSILSKAFASILRTVQITLPDARMQMGHSRNEAFLFRAYAAYSAGSNNIVISFDIQEKDSQTHLCGDIARENDIVIEDIMQAVLTNVCDDVLINHAREFALRCEDSAALIAKELTQVTN